MKFKREKNYGTKKARTISHEGGRICDVDLRSCDIVLDTGVVVEAKPEKYSALVTTMISCDSPICSARNLF